jgi:hypothetical protein
MGKQDDSNGVVRVIGMRPDGSLILSPDDLPFLPVPRQIVIRHGVMRIDEWEFSLREVSRKFLHWFRDRADMWQHLDPSEENRKWVQAVFEAFRDEILNKMK